MSDEVAAGRLDLPRRRLLTLGAAGATTLLLSACGSKAPAAAVPKISPVPERDDSKELEPKAARERLEAGNARFVAGKSAYPDQSLARRKKLGGGQAPFAGILSCADSRVPPELIFDQGLGDLFVVRSAGQVVDDAVLGSLQFGVGELNIPLLVVLGHSSCGAIKATIEAIKKKSPPSGTAIDALVEALKPSVMEAEEGGATEETLLPAAVSNNVDRVVEQLKGSKVISSAIKAGKVRVLGGIYDVDSGEVAFN